MKVLVISQLYPPDMGGGSTRAFNAVKGLARLGHSVTVVAAFPHYPEGKISRTLRGRLRTVERTETSTVVRTWVPSLPSKGLVRRLVLYFAFCISSLLALPLARGNDVIWAANPNVFSIFPAMIISKLTRAPAVANVDDVWPDELYDLGMLKSRPLRRIAERVSKMAYMAPAYLTPISSAYVSALVSKYNGNRAHDEYRVVPAGVDLDEFRQDGHARDADGGAREFRVVYIGAFSPAYDFDQVFGAARRVAGERDIRFLIQGGGELGPDLESKLRSSGLTNVVIVRQIVSRSEVAKILASADALLLPLGGQASIEMGISSKLYEYQAVGKPIICCSRGESAAYVLRTRSGMVAEPGDSEALAEAILRLRANRAMASSLGDAGRRWVEANLSCERVGKLMEGVLEDAMTGRAS